MRPDADVAGIEVVLLGICPQPANGCLAVLDLGGEEGVLAQSVIDARHGVALADQRDRRATFLAAGRPTAPVDPDDDGQGVICLGGQIQVELVAGVSASDILQVAVDLHICRLGRFDRRLLQLWPVPQPEAGRNAECHDDADEPECFVHAEPVIGKGVRTVEILLGHWQRVDVKRRNHGFGRPKSRLQLPFSNSLGLRCTRPHPTGLPTCHGSAPNGSSKASRACRTAR